MLQNSIKKIGTINTLKDLISMPTNTKKDKTKKIRIKKALSLFKSYKGALETGSVLFNS
jgi:hypothetical protein